MVEARRKAVPEPPSVGSIRDDLLRALAPPDHEGPFYAPQAMEMVERFEAALRRDWQAIEQKNILSAAQAAVRRSLEALADGRLL